MGYRPHRGRGEASVSRGVPVIIIQDSLEALNIQEWQERQDILSRQSVTLWEHPNEKVVLNIIGRNCHAVPARKMGPCK